MEELNSLISPCKKLRLESNDTTDLAHIDSDTNCISQTEVSEVHVEHDNAVGHNAFSGARDEVDVFSETSVNGCSESSQKGVQNSAGIHISHASATLVMNRDELKPDDCETDEVLGHSDAFLEKSNVQSKLQPADVNCNDMSTEFQKASDIITGCEEEIQALVRSRRKEVKYLCSGVKVSAIIQHMESGKSAYGDDTDLRKTEESITLMTETNNETSAIDFSIIDPVIKTVVPNLGKYKEDIKDCGCCDDANKKNVFDRTVSSVMKDDVGKIVSIEENCKMSELDTTNVGFDVTDAMNTSDRTIIDSTEEQLEERLELSGASESDKDVVMPEDSESTQNISNEHVYANVIISSPESSYLRNKICNGSVRNGIDVWYSDSNVHTQNGVKNEDLKSDFGSTEYGRRECLDSNALSYNEESKRTNGDGAEVLEETGKYFSTIDDDSDSDIGADGIEMEEDTTNYFCTFEENENIINSHYLYPIREDRDLADTIEDSNVMNAQRLNNTEVSHSTDYQILNNTDEVSQVMNDQKLNRTEIDITSANVSDAPLINHEVDFDRTLCHGQEDPLYSSTPLPPKVNGHDSGNEYSVCTYKLPTFNSFKPSVSTSKSTSGNSRPLLTSTPLLKPYQGLKVRDMNIIQGMSKPISDEKHKILELDLKREENKIVNASEINENEDIAVKIRAVRKHSFSGEIKRIRDSKREKKRNKGVRKERFKEYMGPGLTVGILADDASEVKDSLAKKDFVKNSDIETCTLVEYKGFGLTGPLPDKPLHNSTPLVIDPDFNGGSSQSGGKKSMKHFVSGISLGGRPAGTEGMLIPEFKTLPQKLRQTVSETRFRQKMTQEHTDLRRKTLTRHNSDLGPQGQSKHNRLTGWLASVQAHRPHAVLPTLAEGPVLPMNIPLRPDQAYPQVGARSVGGSSKTESTSNTDKSDKSDKIQVIDPAVLQSQGQLKVSAYMNFGLLTVHVVQGRQLSTKWKNSCDSFVKLSLVPDDGKKPKCRTEVVQDSNNPLYDEKFSFELNEEDHSKRLMISVWHRDTSASVNEFLGCMSFGIRHLTNPKKDVNGWYYLLTEDIGRKKHLQVSHRQRPHLKLRSQANIPSVNKDVWGTESLTLTVRRGKNGFGFTVIEACPVRVGRVDGSSPAELAGLQPGDIIVRLNRQNVSRSTATSVAKLIKHSSNTMILELHRPRPVTYEQLENSVCLSNTNEATTDDLCNYDNDLTSRDSRDHTVPQMYTINDDDEDDNKENEDSIEDRTLYSFSPHLASLTTSTPLPLLARGHKTVQTCEVRKQEAVHRLLSLELDFIDIMHAGMQRYSRPLRHCILSHSQHAALFQNIEKLVTISEYHVKQMHDNAPLSFVSEDDTDTSGNSETHSFIQSIGLIYQSKVHMLCQAYDLYAKGISAANQLLSELRRSDDFVRFVRDPPLEGSQPSISSFIYRPVQHVKELYKVVQEVFSNTSSDSPDYNCLKQVVEGLLECSTNITNYSCERVRSLTSLTSRDSKNSFTCSMKSKSSTSCSSSSSKGHGYTSSKGQGHLLQSSKSVDLEVMKIQDRLVFSPNVPVFQLCQDDRHLIFSGDMFKWEGRQWIKVHFYLFTDMILQTVQEADGYLRVIQEPTFLQDVAAMDAQRQHGTEFVLYCTSRLSETGHSGKRKISLRAPSTEQKLAWKSLIEQRVFSVRGSMDYCSSTSDVSSSSASAIII